MDVRKLVLGAAVVGAAGLAIWWLWGATNLPAPAAPSEKVSPRAAAEAMVAPIGNRETAAATGMTGAPISERDVVASEAPTDKRATATVRGRCVDGSGDPLADCVVTIAGITDDRRLDEWLRDLPDPEWRDLEQTTGADGVFAFTFWPPPPIRLSLRVARAGSGPLLGPLAIEAGSQIDAGDITVLPGVQVSGSVVDAAGRPVADMEVRVITSLPKQGFGFGAGEEAARPAVAMRAVVPDATSDASGNFRLANLVAPGTYSMALIHSGAYKDWHPLALAAERPIEHVTLVCSLAADVATIRGRVVDEQGLGVADAWIQAAIGTSAGRRRGVSDSGGSFTLRRYEGDPEHLELDVPLAGYAMVACDPVAWGSTDVLLVMRRGGQLVVRVTEASDEPVLDYAVRAMPSYGDRNVRLLDAEHSNVRARGPFANGTATIDGIAPGTWQLAIEFPTAAQKVTHVQTIEVGETTGRHVDIRAEDICMRTLRVVTADGEPVAGTEVQLFDYVDEDFGESTAVQALWSQLRRRDNVVTLLASSGTTDAAGTFALRGSAQRPQGLRLLGPGHIPHYDAAVSLQERGDLVVTVQRGARLIAHVTPPAGIDELRRRAGIAAGEPFAKRSVPRLQLSRDVDDREQIVPPDTRELGLMDSDGCCEVASIPAGTWRVGIRHWRILNSSMATTDRADVAEITLADGATAEITLDLSSLLPGTLEGLVMHNGAPFANQRVTLARSGARRHSPLPAKTDAEGRFELLAEPGEYSLQASLDGAEVRWFEIVSPTFAQVTVAQTTRQTFDLQSGTLRATLRDENGAAAAGIGLMAVDAAGKVRWLGATQDDGTLDVGLAAGVVTLTVLPQRLQSEEAREAVREQAGRGVPDPFATHRMALSTVTIRAGQASAIELRLPPEWRR